MPSTYFPAKFVEKFAALLGPDAQAFFDFSKRKLRKCFRVNTLKASAVEVVSSLAGQGFQLEPLPFSSDAFAVLGENVELGKTKEYAEGFIAVQEAASMVPALVLAPQPGQLVLDLAAAPGSKTTQLAALMQNQGAVLALDVHRERLKALKFNLNRVGACNAVVALQDAAKTRFEAVFDRVLVDAPCSSEGLVRKRLDALKGWNSRLVEGKARLQKKLIVAGFDALKPGGEMVYSTCTLSPEENEGVVQRLLDVRPQAKLLPVSLMGFKFRPGFSLKQTAYVLPQDNDSEAFFVARLEKARPGNSEAQA